MLKTVEITVDLRKNPPTRLQLTIMNYPVSVMESVRFLGSTISQDLKWETYIDPTVEKKPCRGCTSSTN